MKRIILLIAGLSAIVLAQSQTVNITVAVSNIKSSNGVIKLCLFNRETGFPEKSNLAVKCISVKAIKGVMQVKIEGITIGNYAIAVHHDENSNGKFDTNFIGIPTETAGVSNGAKGKMGPPKYSDAVITINGNKTQFAIVLD